MTTASPPPQHSFDPDTFRMTIGEHLEDLRRRMIWGLLGFAAAVILCWIFIVRLQVFLCAPLARALLAHNLNPQMAYTNVTEPFMTYLKIWVICSVAIAGPWMLYQLWQFVAAGLYPHERKVVTRYIPLSLTLLIGGMVFVYYIVLPLSLAFFLEFSGTVPLPSGVDNGPGVGQHTALILPSLPGDPDKPQEGELWINKHEGRIKAFFDGNIHNFWTAGDKLLTPMITIAEYIDLVLTFMITFGLAFQLPLVVLALVMAGIVEVSFLKKQRRTIYFVMAIASAFIAPGELVTSMLSLLIPLVILYEFGLWLAQIRLRARAAAEAREG